MYSASRRTSRGATISTQAHLEALKAKHKALEGRLADVAFRHWRGDDGSFLHSVMR